MSTSEFARLLLLGVALLVASPAIAAPPTNDLPASAIAITQADLPFTDARDATEATPDPTAPSGCYDYPDVPQKSAWYTFTSSENAVVEIDTFGSTYDTSLSVTTSCGGGCTSYDACADDSGGKQSQVTLDAFAGQQYRIMVELQKGATCPAGGCQLVLNVKRAREHTVEFRVNSSAPGCYVGASLRTSRTLASDSDFRSGTDVATATATGVGTDFYLYAYSLEFCGNETRPLTGTLLVDGVRVGRVENELPSSRSLSMYVNEIQEPAELGLAVDDPDQPTGSLAATMQTKTKPGCRARAAVSATRRAANDDFDSWSNDRTRRKTARATVPVDPGDGVSFTFGGSNCRDDARIKGAATVGGQAVGSGWLELRSAGASIGGRVPVVQ